MIKQIRANYDAKSIEKEIQEYRVEELKFKPRHKKVKLSAEEVKACANLEKEN